MKTLQIIITCLLILLICNKIQAQEAQQSSELNYKNACSESLAFNANMQVLNKEGTVLKVKTKKGELIFSDTLVEEEDVNMREYEAVGIYESICKAVIKEIRLTETKYILVDLNNKFYEYIDSFPFISGDAKYLATISEPEADDYKGLKIFKIKKGKLILTFEDDNPKHYYLMSSGKWCEHEFYVISKNMSTRKKEYWTITP